MLGPEGMSPAAYLGLTRIRQHVLENPKSESSSLMSKIHLKKIGYFSPRDYVSGVDINML